MISIDWLSFWFEKNSEKLAELKVGFSMFAKNTNTINPAQRVDLDTTRHIASVALWESGECDFEAIELESNVNIFAHHTIQSQEELNEFLVPLVSAL